MWSIFSVARIARIGTRTLATRSSVSANLSANAKPGRKLYILGGTAVVLGGVYLSSATVRDDVDFVAHAVQRSTTVAVALSRCVIQYRKVLKAQYDSEQERQSALNDCHSYCAELTRKALERNAGVFIKLGQHFSALTYIFPDEWTRAMIPLQDQCPVSSISDVRDMIKHDTGKNIDEIFSYFDPVPMGTASLAQVHRAILLNGQEVAVKVQHPTLQRYVPLDIRLTETVFKLVDFFFPEYPLLWLSDEIRRSIFVELDFVQEAENSKKTAQYFKKFYNQTALRIPKVYWAESRLLCMEFLQGIRPDNKKALEAQGIDLKQLSLCFAHIFNNMIFTPNVGLHCDPHAGNIAIKPCNNKHGFEVVLYDHGLYRYVETHVRTAYSHFWLALMNRDEKAMRHYAHEFAGIDDQEFNIFAAAITGRDFVSSTDGSVFQKPRSKDEVMNMQNKLAHDDDLASQIMRMLHSMPPVVLLILKTNDLVRYLDEVLGTPLGMTREFVIMAKYCSSTVFSDERRRSWAHAWFNYLWTQLKLTALLIFKA